ncbi:DUF1566 domain-containing protein, partial [Candidatus Marithioploca araucensis]|nr:DUF1566 domain-containing protein [Candidatus Marithioploca araucensis]
RLNDGTAGAKRTTPFKEPTSAPGSTGKSLNDVMGIAPIINTSGATPAEVLSGKVFWGLVSGNWGLETGIATAGANVTGTDGNLVITITDGLYSGSKTATASDTDLIATNIKSTVDIFGVTGSVVEATGNATAADVLSGKTFSNSSGAGTNGSMADKEGDNASTAQVATAGVNKLTAPTGFYDGDDTVTATDAEIVGLDTGLTAENLKKDVDIFGVIGTYEGGPTCSGTLNGTRWCDNGNGTVMDMTTGLIWLKKADWGGQKQWDGNSHDNAHVRAGILKDGATDAELSDGSVVGVWRLPTKTELVGITTGTDPVSSGNMRAFSGVQAVYYWSSTTFTNFAGNAWLVNLDDGYVSYDVKVYTYYIWPVRGGQ